MQLSAVKNQLIGFTAASGLALVGLGIWTFRDSPIALDEAAVVGTVQNPTEAGVALVPKNDRDFSRLWNMQLRGPKPAVETMTTPVEAPVVVARENFAIKLIGTISESGRLLGLFQDSVGGFDVKSAGEPLKLSPAGVLLARLEAGTAWLQYSGREVTLTKEGARVPAVNSAVEGGMSNEPVTDDGTMPPPPAAFPPSVQPMVMPNGVRPPEASNSDDIFAPLPANMDINNPANFGGVPAQPDNPNGTP